jgi:CRP/FNR family transcriptional regulator, cyclic AMP receptor protein
MTMTTVERVVALQRVGLFADVPGRTLAAVARRATEVDVAAGTLVIAEGAVEDHLFAVVQGRLRVHHDERTVTDLGAGSTVGELAALVPEPRTASVTALESTTLLRIDKPILDALLADRPALASAIIAALVAMVRERTRSEADSTPA